MEYRDGIDQIAGTNLIFEYLQSKYDKAYKISLWIYIIIMIL